MLFLSGCLTLLSLLTLFKAPAKPLWFVAIGVTEWGHYGVVVCGVLAVINWRIARRFNGAAGLALAAAFLYATPYLRAALIARDLPLRLTQAFGPCDPRQSAEAPARKIPLGLTALFKSIPSPDIQSTQVEYARIQGHPLFLEIYRPREKGAPLPGVIVVHGGSWQSGERLELPELNRYLAARGYVVAAVDYRLAPGSIFPAQSEDLFRAIRYLKEHARDIGLDRDRLALLGRSAGGQIALSAAYSQKDPAIKSVVAFYTPNDLAWAYSIPSNRLIMNSQKVIEAYLGGPPAKVPSTYDAASPLHFVNRTTPPTLMIHGARDELVWAQHDERLSARLAEHRRPYLYLNLPWATHGCDANFTGPCGQLSTYAVERFLAATLYMIPEERMAYSDEPNRYHS